MVTPSGCPEYSVCRTGVGERQNMTLALLQGFKSVLAELNTQAVKHNVQLDRFKRLEVLNPQFLCTHDTTWETNKPLLKLPNHFFDEWNRYVTMDVAKAKAVDDTVQFWHNNQVAWQNMPQYRCAPLRCQRMLKQRSAWLEF